VEESECVEAHALEVIDNKSVSPTGWYPRRSLDLDNDDIRGQASLIDLTSEDVLSKTNRELRGLLLPETVGTLVSISRIMRMGHFLVVFTVGDALDLESV
jgi:hypothetical protein